MPVVTCASWKNYVMVVGNGAARGDGTTELTYSIEDVLNDEMIQDGDTVALPPDTHLKSVFFSEDGVHTLSFRRGLTSRIQRFLIRKGCC
jgi:chromosome transmission fidelity protein 4